MEDRLTLEEVQKKLKEGVVVPSAHAVRKELDLELLCRKIRDNQDITFVKPYTDDTTNNRGLVVSVTHDRKIYTVVFVENSSEFRCGDFIIKTAYEFEKNFQYTPRDASSPVEATTPTPAAKRVIVVKKAASTEAVATHDVKALAKKAVRDIELGDRRFCADTVHDYVAELRYNGLSLTDDEATKLREAIIVRWFYENY